MVKTASVVPTYPFDILKDYPYSDWPNHVILREIGLKYKPGTLELYFSGGEDIWLGPNSKAEFEKLVNAVCADDYVFKTPAPALKNDYSSPLSLRNGQVSYVIYKLAKGTNWQIAREKLPVSAGDKGRKYCFEGHRLDKRGYAYRDKGGSLRENCNVVYFVADGVSPKVGDKYDFPINIHIDLVYDTPAPRRVIPLIVDPDVRYPGGSGQ